MRQLPEVYTVRGVYAVGPKQMLGKPCSASHWTRYERHDAVSREATAAHPWMKIRSIEKYTGTTYGGLPLRDLREAMAKGFV